MLSRERQHDQTRLLVVLPNWVGDVVLATPALRTLRAAYAESHIAYLTKPYVQDVLSDCPWSDEVLLWPGEDKNLLRRTWSAAQLIRRHHFDIGLLMTNSFRTALVLKLAGVPKRVGYARDCRSWLLTQALPVPKDEGRYAIESMLDYYGRLPQALGAGLPQGPLELSIDEQSRATVDDWWREFGIEAGQRVVLLNPGAKFGTSKLYPADRFAKVGDRLTQLLGAKILINAGPGEQEIAQAVSRQMQSHAHIISPPRLNLKLLKALIAKIDLLITNDTGPRHFAIALNTPVVTIFGSTHPGWTETNCPYEKQISIPVNCGPCQKPFCPLDLRCLTGISPEMVVTQARELLGQHSERPSS